MSRQTRATGMDLKLVACALTVHDLNEALSFYRDVLGFEVHTDAAPRVSVGPPSQPDVRILLRSPGTDPSVSPVDRQLIQEVLANGRLGQVLVFLTDNCDTTFERIEAAGAEVAQEPIDQPGGARDCAFFDRSGNQLRFTQPRQAHRG